MHRIASGFGILEAPFHAAEGRLLFSDVLRGGVYSIGADGGVETVIEHRRGIGGLAAHEQGGLIVTGRNVSWKHGLDSRVLLEADPERDVRSFNDLTVDGRGRICVGALNLDPPTPEGSPRPSHVLRIELDGSVTVLADDVLFANGLAFSADGKTLLLIDSARRCLWAFPVDEGDGLGSRRLLASWESATPDGLAISADGAIWVALATAQAPGLVVALEPGGRERGRLEVPAPMVTNVCFGGADLADLYVVTGHVGAGADGGAIYKTRVGVPGLPLTPARIAPA